MWRVKISNFHPNGGSVANCPAMRPPHLTERLFGTRPPLRKALRAAILLARNSLRRALERSARRAEGAILSASILPRSDLPALSRGQQRPWQFGVSQCQCRPLYQPAGSFARRCAASCMFRMN